MSALVRHVISNILISFTSAVLFINGEGAQNAFPITREKAIEISNKEVVKLGLDPRELEVKVDEGNKEWNEFVAMKKRSLSSIGAEARREFEQQESQLKGRMFWTINYNFKAKPGQTILGGATVFVDAMSGEVLLVIPGH